MKLRGRSHGALHVAARSPDNADRTADSPAQPAQQDGSRCGRAQPPHALTLLRTAIIKRGSVQTQARSRMTTPSCSRPPALCGGCLPSRHLGFMATTPRWVGFCRTHLSCTRLSFRPVLDGTTGARARAGIQRCDAGRVHDQHHKGRALRQRDRGQGGLARCAQTFRPASSCACFGRALGVDMTAAVQVSTAYDKSRRRGLM